MAYLDQPTRFAAWCLPGRLANSMNSVSTSDKAILERYADVAIDRDSLSFWRGCASHRLLVGRCADCGRFRFPLLPMCPECWSTTITYVPSAGEGTIALLMSLRRGPAYPAAHYDDAPYTVGAVELAEQAGLRLTAPIISSPGRSPRIGDRVQLTWIESGGAEFPAFRVLDALDKPDHGRRTR
jgi:uncharacterized protein